MGSQSSSGMSGGRGSSSGTPAESDGENQGRGRRSDRQQGERQSSEEDVDLAEVLAYLLRRGQVRLVHGSGATGLQLVQSYSDSDEDSDGAWEGRLGDRYNPPVDVQPDTNEVDCSEIRTQILLATASSTLKGRHSFTHMLAEREQGRCRGSSFSHGECSRIRTHFLPNYVSHKDTYQQKAFCGVYSENGNMFLSACQDQNIRLYDTTRGRFILRRTVKARDVGWSVLDVCFSPDAHHVLYSSWSDYIHLCSIDGDSENHTALDLKLVSTLIVTYNYGPGNLSFPTEQPTFPFITMAMNDAVNACHLTIHFLSVCELIMTALNHSQSNKSITSKVDVCPRAEQVRANGTHN